jgi:uncharacterized protein involved in type VI secretion and phage assembly
MSAGGPRVKTGDMTLFGVHYAVVTQNQDPDKLARVAVKLPWLDHGDQDQTYWALCAFPMAGDKYGFYTLPDVNDVVAVMFIAGDISRPVVLGGVWSKTDTAPESSGDFRGYRSRTGARMVMDDSSNGKVYINDKGNKNGVIVGSFQQGGSGGQAQSAPGAKTVNGPQAQQGVAIYSLEGDIQITSKGKLTVTAQTHIDIVSDQSFDCKAKGAATIEGDGMATVSGDAGVKADGSETKVN